MIYTSYFSKSGNLGNAVSIALMSPDFFKGAEYPDLFPTKDLLNSYKYCNMSEKVYEKKYLELLNNVRDLDLNKVAKELDGKVIICWENSNKFCHRHVVAKWLRPYIEVKELVVESKYKLF